jgi:hypothetical protein
VLIGRSSSVSSSRCPPSLIRATTETGALAETRARVQGIAATGVEGVLYGPMGPDIARELHAFADAAQL